VTYHVVFDISQRIPEAVVAGLAIPGLLALIAASLRAGWRASARRCVWVVLLLVAVDWSVFNSSNLGWGAFGLEFGFGVGLLLTCAAIGLHRKGPEFAVTSFGGARLGNVGLVLSGAVLALLAFQGAAQWRSVSLLQQLHDGRALVTVGTVTNASNPNWGNESFEVSGRRFDYSDSSSYIGFHQTAANGGPIRNGLQVRVWTIGDVIVRLEIADR
jgi:hypothetical protein